MPDTAPLSFWMVLEHTIMIVVSLSVLFLLFVIIPSNCAGIVEAAHGGTTCHLEPAAYLFGAVFVVILLYAGFILFSMLFPNKKVSCRICSLLSKR
jgi:uncharacterized BrkB/YihY/UPF0761 family membrane protein